MNDRQALLRSIIADPDADLPRLVFADWLEENGEPKRAEFIRAQVRLAAAEPDDPEVHRLREVEWERGFDARKQSLAELPRFDGVHWQEVDGVGAAEGEMPLLERGLPGRVTALDVFDIWDEDARLNVPLREIVDQTPIRHLGVRLTSRAQWEQFLRLPALEHLRGLSLDWFIFLAPFADDEEDILAELARCKRLAGLRRLDYRVGFSTDGVTALAGSPHLKRVTELTISTDGLNPALLGTLAHSPFARRLRRLELYTEGYGVDADELLPVLAAAPLPELRTLSVTDANLTAEGVRSLTAAAASWPRLRELHLSRNPLGPSGAAALAESLRHPLSSLRLTGCDVGSGGARALAGCAALSGLRELLMADNETGPGGARSLARSPHLGKLRVLDLENNPLRPRGMHELARGPALRSLYRLSLAETGWVRDRAYTVAELRPVWRDMNLPELRRLDVSGRRLWTAGARELARNGRLGQLRELVVNDCSLTDAGTQALIAAPALQRLVRLDAGGNHIREGANDLARARVMPELRECLLMENPLTPAQRRKLRRRFGRDSV